MATTQLPPDGLVLPAAEQIHRLIDTAAEGEPHARGSLHDLFVLSYKALAALHHNPASAPPPVARVLDECGGGLPPRFSPLGPVHAHTVAVAATLATIAYADDEAGTTLLAWIVEHDRHIAHPEPSQLQRRWKQCGPHLTGRVLALSDGHLRLYHRLALRTATAHPQPAPADSSRVHRRAAALPALLWPGWSMRLVPAESAAYNRLEAVYSELAELTMPDDQWDALATPGDGDHGDLLHPERLHHLYHQRQTTLDDIAYQSLTTTAVIRHRLESTGTRLVPHRPRTKTVPAEWFQDNYIAAGKSLRQAAAEAGAGFLRDAAHALQQLDDSTRPPGAAD